jgi:hypothetical protein
MQMNRKCFLLGLVLITATIVISVCFHAEYLSFHTETLTVLPFNMPLNDLKSPSVPFIAPKMSATISTSSANIQGTPALYARSQVTNVFGKEGRLGLFFSAGYTQTSEDSLFSARDLRLKSQHFESFDAFQAAVFARTNPHFRRFIVHRQIGSLEVIFMDNAYTGSVNPEGFLEAVKALGYKEALFALQSQVFDGAIAILVIGSKKDLSHYLKS